MPFRDRKDAGERLAKALEAYRGQDCLVLALPRGGVPVAAEVAKTLNAPMDLVLVRKVGVPSHPELAMGAVVDGVAPIVVRNESVIAMAGVRPADFDRVASRERAEIERRRTLYLGSRKPHDPQGRVAIIVDDGLATGSTMQAALRAIRRRRPAKLVMAVPVAPRETLEDLRKDADAIVCLESPEDFGAVGYFYDDFTQVEDDAVIALLAAHA